MTDTWEHAKKMGAAPSISSASTATRVTRVRGRIRGPYEQYEDGYGGRPVRNDPYEYEDGTDERLCPFDPWNNLQSIAKPVVKQWKQDAPIVLKAFL